MTEGKKTAVATLALVGAGGVGLWYLWRRRHHHHAGGGHRSRSRFGLGAARAPELVELVELSLLGPPLEAAPPYRVTPHGTYGAHRAGPPVHEHQGVDLQAPKGAAILAVGDGVIVPAQPGLGKTVLKLTLDRPGRWIEAPIGPLVYHLVYADLGTPLVHVGERVRRGQPIARVWGDNFFHFAAKTVGSHGEEFFDPARSGLDVEAHGLLRTMQLVEAHGLLRTMQLSGALLAERNAAGGESGSAGELVEEGVTRWLKALSVANPEYTYDYDVGPVYLRVWKRLGKQTSRSVVAFVARASGMVHRADSWKKPGRPLVPLAAMLDGTATAPRNTTYRSPLDANGTSWADWVTKLDGSHGVYFIRDRESREILYVGESHTGRLRPTMQRHLWNWNGRGSGPSYDPRRVEVAVEVYGDPDAAIAAQFRHIQRLSPRDNVQDGHSLTTTTDDEVPF